MGFIFRSFLKNNIYIFIYGNIIDTSNFVGGPHSALIKAKYSPIIFFNNSQYGNYWSNYTAEHPGAQTSDGLTWHTPYHLNDSYYDYKPLVERRVPLDPVNIELEGDTLLDNVTTGKNVNITISSKDTDQPRCNITLGTKTVYNGTWTDGQTFNLPLDDLEIGEYELKVEADSGVFDNKASKTWLINITVPLPAEPVIIQPLTNTTLEGAGSVSVEIQWRPVQYATFYKVYVNGIYINGTSATAQTLTFLYNGTYSIAVTAVNARGESAYSNSIVIEAIVHGKPDLSDSPNNTWIIGLGVGLGAVAVIGSALYISKKK